MVSAHSGKQPPYRLDSPANRVGRLVEQAKADFLLDQQEQLQDDPKSFWRLVKSIVPGKHKGYGKISLNYKDKEGKESELEGGQVPDFINDFFCNIGPKLAKQHNEQWQYYGVENNETCPLTTTDFLCIC